MQDNLEETLRNRFRLPAFRKGQREIIASVLAGKDVLAVLPTGGGKSLCYQLPAVHTGKLAVVVSPLIALMRDQVASLTRNGIPAGCLHSGQTEDEKREVFRKIGEGGTFLLYLSPERVQKEGFHRWIAARDVGLFAVDEAHCVSQWGHDFREEYAQLGVLKALRPDVPTLALTASATPMVLSDIARALALSSPARHVHGFYRPNLYYQVESCADEETKLRFLKQAVSQTPAGRILVYCGTRQSAEDVASALSQDFEGVGFYHAGLGPEKRTEVQNAYSAGKIRVLAATNAFGMGIDHPDVRLVVHHQMPGNIDALYQEMGRAGRDGQDSTCLMLYSKKDKGLQSFFIQRSDAPAAVKKLRWETLDAIVGYAEGGECRHGEVLIYYQDSQRLESCGHCDSCAPDSPRKIRRPEMRATPAILKKSRRRATAEANELLDGVEQIRFSALKDWRKRKAKELEVAAFMIFSDRTLRELARANPKTSEALSRVYGIGESKLEAFGTELLAELGGK